MSEVLQEIREALHELREHADRARGPGGVRKVVNVILGAGAIGTALYAIVGVMGWTDPVVDHIKVTQTVDRQREMLDRQQQQLDQLVENVEYNRWFRDYQVCIDTGKSPLACQAQADEKKEEREARKRGARGESSQ